MWHRAPKKTIFTLNINYDPNITDLTYPLLKRWARRIGADLFVIDKRKFHKWPVVYEKLQIFELAQEMKNDWNIYVDGDALVHPETVDFTDFLPRDTVAHNGADMAAIRWKCDQYFKRDGRNIGSCNWFTIGSDLCIDLWRPLEIPFSEAVANIFPTVDEINTIITPDHLIDDYALSRNIAKFGLKFTTIKDLLPRIGLTGANFFWHLYTITHAEKIALMKETITKWQVDTFMTKDKR